MRAADSAHELEPTAWTAAAMARAIRARTISAAELVEAHLAQIAALDGTLGAIAITDPERARARARSADRQAGAALRPLHGVPVTVKEELSVAGLVSRGASRLCKPRVDERDCTIVTRLRRAGAIPIGKTNMSELAMFPDTDNRVYGATRNPHDLSRSAGGSSGGEAAAVAAGLSPLGIGGDYAGSIRCPAHFCGIAGLRAGIGTVPQQPAGTSADAAARAERWTPGCAALSTWGPLARSVEDLELGFAVLAGLDPTVTPPAPGRVAVATVADPAALEPACALALEQAVAALSGAGLRLAAADPPARRAAEQSFDALSAHESRQMLGRWLPGRLREASIAVAAQWQALTESPPAPVDVAAELRHLERLAASVDAWLREHGPLLVPASSGTAFELGRLDGIFERFADCRLASALGLPALVVPVLTGPDQLPAGVQLIGWRGGERELLGVGRRLEGALGGPPSVGRPGLSSAEASRH